MELELEGVTASYGGITALSDISFTVTSGQVVTLLGPNGSGKSTLIKTIAGILRPTRGRLVVDGTDIQRIDPIDLATRIGYVPQQYTFTLYATVFETVLLGRRPFIKWSVSEEELSRVESALEAVGMTGSAGKFMDQLSGGERQKVFIARALAQDPALYLFDEPTSALDIRYQLGVMETLRDLAIRRGAAVVIAVHDLNLAYRYADAVIMLDKGRLVANGLPENVLTPDRIEKVYGVNIEVVRSGNGQFLMPVRQSR